MYSMCFYKISQKKRKTEAAIVIIIIVINRLKAFDIENERKKNTIFFILWDENHPLIFRFKTIFAKGNVITSWV